MDARVVALESALNAHPGQRRWIVGYSGGGFDALHALQRGADVDGVVLLNAAFGPADEHERVAYRAMANALRSGALNGTAVASALLTPAGAADAALAARVAAWLDAATRDHIANEIDSYARQPALDDVVDRFAERIVIVHGTHDASVPVERARAVAARSGARYVELEGLGHAALVEAPDVVCDALRRAWSADG